MPSFANEKPWPKKSMYGIGLMLDQARLGSPVIISEITPHGPCAKSGKIRVNDRLAMVDGIPASSLAGEELSSLIFGLEGTKIRLTIEREDAGYPQRFDITVTRGPADANGTMENGRVGDGVHKDSKDSGEHKRGILHSLVAMLKILQSLDLPLESDRPPMTDDTARTREGKLVNFVFQEVKMLKQHQFVAHQLIQTVRDSVYAQQDIANDVAVRDALKAYEKQTELLSLEAFKNHKGGPNIYSSHGSKFSETSLGASEQAAEEIDAALAASEHDSLRLQNTILKMDIVRKDRELTALRQKQGGGHGNLPREKSQPNGENTNSIQHVTDTYTNVNRARSDGKSLSTLLPTEDLGGSSIKYGKPQDASAMLAKGTPDKEHSSRTGVQTILPLKAVDAQPLSVPMPLPGDPVQWSPKVQKSVSRFNESAPSSAVKEVQDRATRDLHIDLASEMQRASQLSDYQRASQDKLSAPPSPFFGTALDPLANNTERMERRWPPPNSNALVPPPSTPILGDVQSLSLSLAIPERKFNNLFSTNQSPPDPPPHESQPGRLEHLLERSKRLTSEASDMLSGRPAHTHTSTLASNTSPLTRQAVEELLEGDRKHQPLHAGGSAEASSNDPVLERIRRWQKDVPAPTNFNFQDTPPVSAAKPPAAPLSVRPPTTPSNHGDGAPWDPKPPESPLSMTNSEKKMRSVDEIKARRAAHNQAQDNLLRDLAAALPTDKPPRDPSIRQPSSTPSKVFGSDSALDPGRLPLTGQSSDLLPPKPASSPSRLGVNGVPLSNSFSAMGSSPVLGPSNPAGYPGSFDEGRLASIDRGLQNLRSTDSVPSTAFTRQSDNPELGRGASSGSHQGALLRASDDASMLGRNNQSAFTAYSNRHTADGLGGMDSHPKRTEEMARPWARDPSPQRYQPPARDPSPQRSQPPAQSQQSLHSGMRASSPNVSAAQPIPSSLQWQEGSNERAARDYYTPPVPPTNNWQDVPNQRRDFQPSYHRTPPPPSQPQTQTQNFQHGAPPQTQTQTQNFQHGAPPPPNRRHSPGPAMNHAAPPPSHAHTFTPSHSPVVHPQRQPSPSHFSMAPPPIQVAPPQYGMAPAAQHHPPNQSRFTQHQHPPPRAHAVPQYGANNGDYQLLSVRTVQSNMNLKPGPRVWGDTACWA